MTYAEAIRFLDSRVNYEKLHGKYYTVQDFKLERVAEFHRLLGSPADGMNIVHVTGTKGKGSTSAMIAGILERSGRNVGFFQSPHLTYLGERFQFNGVPCPEDEIGSLMAEILPVLRFLDLGSRRPPGGGELPKDAYPASLPPGGRQLPSASFPAVVSGPCTWFEIVTMLALLYFRRKNADTAVLEVGMGGRLDATNICTPLVSVITGISLDHTRQLGETLAEIAYEKAGVVKPAVPVVCGVRESEAKAVIAGIAEARCAEVFWLGEDFSGEFTDFSRREFTFRSRNPVSVTENYEIGMNGRHQGMNAALAAETAIILREKYGFSIPREAIREALRETRLPGRMEFCPGKENVLLDVAHNEASVDATLAFLRETFPSAKKRFIFAVSADKDWRRILQKLAAEADAIYLTEYRANSRFTPATELFDFCHTLDTHAEVYVFPDSREAVREALSRHEAGDVLTILGSFFLVAEVREFLGTQAPRLQQR